MADLKKEMITEIERWINLHELESKEIEDLKAINHTLSESYHKSQGRVRDLERQLSEARKENENLRECFRKLNIDSMAYADRTTDKITAYQSAFGKVRDKLEALSDPMNWHSRQMVGEPEYLRFTTWTYPIDQKGNAPLIIAEEALTLLSALNAQDATQPGQGKM